MEEKELTPEQMLIETQALLIALKLINLNQKMEICKVDNQRLQDADINWLANKLK
jgi:hypothetical protein